ncbi:MAG TPA: hypothetical protein VHC69_26580 [Polyangiaceae bacterium]|nr:hypothetical protein [Polyangiaceae bacterium]
MTPRRHPKRRIGPAIVVALLCAAPVPGDIGACGQPVARLDADRFFTAKRNIDCDHCKQCGIDDETCTADCGKGALEVESFPSGCEPLVHDGEVCLRKLLDTGCDDYARYLDDTAPTVPSECDFCPSEP